MLNVEKRPLTDQAIEAIQIIVAALPDLPDRMLENWRGRVECLEELRRIEDEAS